MKKILMVLAGIITSLTFSIGAAWGGNEYYYDTLYGRDAGNGYTGVPTPYYNTFIGAGAGYLNYTSPTAHGYNDVFLGYGSGYNNTSSYDNVFAGYESGTNNNTGYYNNTMKPPLATNSISPTAAQVLLSYGVISAVQK